MQPTTTGERQWFVFYTKSRHEKKVEELLLRKGVEVFLPRQKVMRQWSDRKKRVEVPLFNSYIFVNTFEHEINEVLQTPGVSWTIRHNGRPAVLRPAEIETIKRFLSTGFFLETGAFEPDRFEKGDRATVIDGPLKGISGIITETGEQDTFQVLIDGIQQVIRVQLHASLLRKDK